MLNKFFKKSKSAISNLIAIVMALTIFSSIPVNADTGVIIYNYDCYSIEYTVKNEWQENQNVEIKLTNTGDEPILNWALKYNATGEINGIWNGTIHNNDNTKYVIKNVGYNYEVEPNESVTFGYILTGKSLTTPKDFELCSKRVIVKEGYDVEFNIVNTWETSFQGEIVLKNSGAIPLEAWTLSFDSNFDIDNLWGSRILNIDNSNYTIASQMWTNPIKSGDSIKVEFIALLGESIEPSIENVSVSVVQIDCDMTKINDNYTFNDIITDDSDDVVGRIYFKDITSADEIGYDENGFGYVKNQILLTAYDYVAFETVKELVESMNARIVGFIELTNDYQIELNYDLSYENLNTIINELQNDISIEFSTFNYVCEAETALTAQERNNIYNLGNINDYNWNYNAINVFDAWKIYTPIMELRNPVKLGLIDGEFESKNNYINFNNHIWNNSNVISDNHGTHVAGTMAAGYFTDNGFGLSGICPNNIVYGVSFLNKVSTDNIINILPSNSLMKWKYSLALLIGNNVKVVNISMTTGSEINKKSTMGTPKEQLANQEYMHNSSETICNLLSKLIDKGYDFIIVSAAGNEGDKGPVSTYINSIKQRNLLTYAKYANYFNYISQSETSLKKVKDRIIVVGSIGYDKDSSGNPKVDSSNKMSYHYSEFSNLGVDVVAPGEDIYSTIGISGCKKDQGTSMASPHVAGVAGMMYLANPGITGDKVKKIIINTANETIELSPYTQVFTDGRTPVTVTETFKLVDAYAAVRGAYEIDHDNDYPEVENKIILGKVEDNNVALDNVIVNYYTIKDGKQDGETKIACTDENGEFTLILEKGSLYKIEYQKTGYVTKSSYCNVTDYEIEYWEVDLNSLSPITVKTIGTDTHIVSANVCSIVTSSDSTDIDILQLETDENGMFALDCEDGTYTITVNKDGYIPRTLQVEVKDGKVYENGYIIGEILLTPIEITITGKVEEYNKTTEETKPVSGLEVTIHPMLESGEASDAVIGSAKTNSSGTYSITLYEQGDITVKFSEDRQIPINVYYGEYIVDALFEVEDEEDDEEDDDEKDNDKDKDNDSDPDNDEDKENDDERVIEIGYDGIVISTEVDDPSQDASNANTQVTGDYNVDLKSGIYIDCGEYTYHYYVKEIKYTSAEIWTAFHVNQLVYDVYKNGKLLSSNILGCWYERVVSSSNYNRWIHTEYISSVGTKIIEKNGTKMLVLTYTFTHVWNPDQHERDTVKNNTVYLMVISDETPIMRTK